MFASVYSLIKFNTCRKMQSKIEKIIDRLKVLSAVEVLEYHNKIWLAASDATRSEWRQDEYKCLLNAMNDLAIDFANTCAIQPQERTIHGTTIPYNSKMRQG